MCTETLTGVDHICIPSGYGRVCACDIGRGIHGCAASGKHVQVEARTYRAPCDDDLATGREPLLTLALSHSKHCQKRQSRGVIASQADLFSNKGHATKCRAHTLVNTVMYSVIVSALVGRPRPVRFNQYVRLIQQCTESYCCAVTDSVDCCNKSLSM